MMTDCQISHQPSKKSKINQFLVKFIWVTMKKTILLTMTLLLLYYVKLPAEEKPLVIEQEDINYLPLKKTPHSSIHDRLNDITENGECKPYLIPNGKTEKWKSERKHEIFSFLYHHKDLNQYLNLLSEASIKSGIGIFHARRVWEGFKGENRVPPYHQESAILASAEEIILVKNIAKNKDYSKLNEYIINGTINESHYFPTLNHTQFLFSYIISHIINGDSNELSLVIDKLIDSGVNITYSDLVYLVKNNVSKELIEKVYIASHLDPKKVLKRFGFHTSFTLLALKLGNENLIDFWVKEGSPLVPDLYSPNALDYLAKYGKQYDQKVRNSLFKKIISLEALPFFEKNYAELEKIISPSVFKPFKDRKRTKKPELTQEEEKKIDSYVVLIHEISLTKIVNEKIEKIKNAGCFSSLGYEMTRYIMTPRKNSLDKNSLDKISDVEKKQMTNIYKDLEKGQLGSLSIKQKLLQDKLDRINKLKNEPNFSEISSSDKLTQQTLADVFRLAKEGLWEEAIRLLEQLNIEQESIMTTLLILAINTNADIDVIIDFINKGGELPNATINRLIYQQNIKLAKKLLPYGLELNYIDPLGFSALAQAAKYNSLTFLSFLLDNGVEIDSYNEGFDALDIVLQNYKDNPIWLTMVSYLLAAGAIIESSHKELAQSIKKDDIDAYMKLINQSSEFIF